MFSRKKNGKKLRKLRNSNNETVGTLAKALKISPSSIFMYESGDRTPRPEVMEKYARHYKTTVGCLFFDEECRM